MLKIDHDRDTAGPAFDPSSPPHAVKVTRLPLLGHSILVCAIDELVVPQAPEAAPA
jgi:hypothetical protein